MIGVLGTSIGVALTFGLNGMLSRRQQDRVQRLTAIMIIHDIDESIDILRGKKDQEEENGKLLQYAMDNRDSLDKMSYDTLTSITFAMLDRLSDFRFDTSKEKIFNSDLDTWQNLGNMKFIDNVQSFFYDRQSFEDSFNSEEVWARPVSREEYMQLFMGEGWLTQERVCEILAPFLKEKLHDKRVTYFIDVASYRLRELNRKIDEWKALNEENKFLMGITDRELEEYVNSMVVDGVRVKKRSLLGTWNLFMEENNNYDYTFNSDHSFSVIVNRSDEGYWEYWSGAIKTRTVYNGTWDMKGDSLIMVFSPFTPGEEDIEIDGSGLVPKEGKRDSLDSWLNHAHENSLEEYRESCGQRSAFRARMDSSKDKMKWTDEEESVYFLKRSDL